MMEEMEDYDHEENEYNEMYSPTSLKYFLMGLGTWLLVAALLTILLCCI
jgi:hypothetical protein